VGEDSVDIKPASYIGIGAIGEPGKRTFFLAVKGEDIELWLKCEKTLVEALSAGLEDLLRNIERDLGRPRVADPTDILESLEDPEEPPVFAGEVAELGIGYDSEDDLVVLVARSPFSEGDREEYPIDGSILEDLDEDIDDEAREVEVRMWITRRQAEALAFQGAIVAAAGRKPCPFCLMPMDSEGHECFGGNGHREGGAIYNFE
jgi:uncharacterized repeat protein (TIGR03847 family)